MWKKTLTGLLLAAGTLAGPACSGQEDESVVVVRYSATCVRGDETPEPCVVSDRVEEDGSHVMTFAATGGETRFVGRPQSGWWSGELDGRPAMGYERNRGHVVYSTLDLTTTFAWWSEGNEHGSY